MIVACPACSARYRIDRAKIKGRGAKITCPRCKHKFVIYKEKGTLDIADSDFSKVGITWRVKKGVGVIQDFASLGELLKMIEDNQVGEQDTLSYDNRTWIPLHSVENLAGFFTEIWKRAERGELKIAEENQENEEEFIEDEFDSPTTVIKNRDLLLKHLREEEEKEAEDSSGRTSSLKETPSPVYRTRSVQTRPAYLSDELGEAENTVEEVIQVHDPKHIKSEPAEPEAQDDPLEPRRPSQTTTDEPGNMHAWLISALVVIFLVTSGFALIEYFKVDVPFLTNRTEIKPQTKPKISLPPRVPDVPNNERSVPTDPTSTPPIELPENKGKTEASENQSSDTDAPINPPPTGEVETPSGGLP